MRHPEEGRGLISSKNEAEYRLMISPLLMKAASRKLFRILTFKSSLLRKLDPPSVG